MAEVDLGIEGLSDYKEIGSGGFATVYSAYEVEADRTVAVKVFTAIDDRARRRFDRERRTMGPTTEHPNIVTMLRSGYTDPEARPFLVLEYMSRGSLQDHLDEVGLIPLAEAVAVVVPVAEALGFAHSTGIVHKDVKPANILVDRFGVVKLTDFGIAGIKEATATSQVAFSLAYTPPETFVADSGPEAEVADPRDERSDLYSLAITLYALVVGAPPFTATNSAALMNRILTQPVPPVQRPGLDGFFATALAKDPDDRFQTSAAFTAALRELVDARVGPNQPDEGNSNQDTLPGAGPEQRSVAIKNPAPQQPETILRSRPPADPGTIEVPAMTSRPWSSLDTSTGPGAEATALSREGRGTDGPNLDADSPPIRNQNTTKSSSGKGVRVGLAGAVVAAVAALGGLVWATTNNPGITADDLVSEGAAHYDAGEFEAAIEDYDQAITLDPSNAQAFYSRGFAYRRLGEYSRAIEDLDQAITLDPNYALAFNNRGVAYNELGEYERAIEDYDQAITLDPNYALAFHNRGIAYNELGEYSRAIEDLDQAITLDPNNDALAFNNRGFAYNELGEYERAIEDYDQAITLDPNNAGAFHNRGIAYQNLGEDELELADRIEALRLVDSGEASHSPAPENIQFARDRVAELSQ